MKETKKPEITDVKFYKQCIVSTVKNIPTGITLLEEINNIKTEGTNSFPLKKEFANFEEYTKYVTNNFDTFKIEPLYVSYKKKQNKLILKPSKTQQK